MLFEKLKADYFIELILIFRDDGFIRRGFGRGNIRDIDKEACA